MISKLLKVFISKSLLIGLFVCYSCLHSLASLHKSSAVAQVSDVRHLCLHPSLSSAGSLSAT